MAIKFSSKTEKWIARVAQKNNCTREQVIKYLSDISSSKKVLSHLKLVCFAVVCMVLSHP